MAIQQSNNVMFRRVRQMVAPGAKTDVYDCLDRGKVPEGSIFIVTDMFEFSYITLQGNPRVGSVLKTSSIHSAVSIERRLVTDRQTHTPGYSIHCAMHTRRVCVAR